MSDQGVATVPRSAGRLIADTLYLYRRYPGLFLALAAAVIVPYQLVVLAATQTGPLTQSSLSASAALLLTMLEWALVTPLVSSLHIHAVAEARRGERPQLGPVALQGIRSLPVVAAASIISWLGVTVGFFLFIIPGLILILRWVVVAQAAALEREGWLPALRRSADLSRGNYWHVFAFLALVGVIAFGPIFLAGLLSGETTTALSFLVGLALQILLASFVALATALLYFDLRARLEAAPAPEPRANGAVAAPGPEGALAASVQAGAPPQPQKRSWDPRAFSDQERPSGWYVDPDSPERMRFWGAGDPPGWSGRTRTSGRIRREWERESSG